MSAHAKSSNLQLSASSEAKPTPSPRVLLAVGCCRQFIWSRDVVLSAQYQAIRTGWISLVVLLLLQVTLRLFLCVRLPFPPALGLYPHLPIAIMNCCAKVFPPERAVFTPTIAYCKDLRCWHTLSCPIPAPLSSLASVFLLFGTLVRRHRGSFPHLADDRL
ncbi:hypothetical protein PYCCODRAFT_14170 [Trametes coccinea BRFM310]|uniref:Uncharacterized protein n=1 Tax=Trametes coccinea (strain BRFM310) TaxID=1353009 RepID=A0A1Y2J7C6_TRAC3|nr:hypothetical protein PYCCODRAFT_14170 [Trametes coccinea BRFM310]